MTSQSVLRWGILGTGMIAGKFASQLPLSKTGLLAGVASRADSSAARFADGLTNLSPGKRPRLHGRYDDLLEDPDIDAVYVALPNHLHGEWSKRALAAGKHVLCEKPMALTADEAEAMFEAAKAADRILVEAFMYRALAQTKQLHEVIRSGAIGEIRLIRANFTFSREVVRSDARYQAHAGGGSIMDVGCYCVDFARSLAGAEPVQVHAAKHQHEFGVDDCAAGVLGFPGGELATFTCGMTVHSDQTSHIAGTKGRIEIPRFWTGSEGFTLIRPDETERHFPSSCENQAASLYAVEADAFAAVVRGGANWNPPENTLGNMRVLETLLRCE